MCNFRNLLKISKKLHLNNSNYLNNYKYYTQGPKFIRKSCNDKFVSALYKNIRDFSCGSTVVFSNSVKSEAKNLADEILQSKIEEQKKQSGSKDSGKKEKDDGGGGAGGEFSKRAMKLTFIAFGASFSICGGILVYEWGAPPIDENGELVRDEFSDMPQWKAYLLRTLREMRYYNKMIKEPSREKLLPDPLTEPYFQPPYTLVLEMTGILVHPDWTYQTGWRFKKRPWLDYFLQQVGPPLFEIVIYTQEQGFTAFPIIDILDPQGYVMYRLFRDATRYQDGHHIKDLACLNRDLSKVIFIDWNEKSFSLQPENALKLKKWNGEDGDKSLIELAAFLRTIASSGIEDVRTVLSFYQQFDDPIAAFKENQRRLQEEQEKASQQLQERGSNPTLASKTWNTGIFKLR